jgi:hypothetical protein
VSRAVLCEAVWDLQITVQYYGTSVAYNCDIFSRQFQMSVTSVTYSVYMHTAFLFECSNGVLLDSSEYFSFLPSQILNIWMPRYMQLRFCLKSYCRPVSHDPFRHLFNVTLLPSQVTPPVPIIKRTIQIIFFLFLWYYIILCFFMVLTLQVIRPIFCMYFVLLYVLYPLVY